MELHGAPMAHTRCVSGPTMDTTKKEKGIHEVCQSSGLSCYGNIGAVCAKNGLRMVLEPEKRKTLCIRLDVYVYDFHRTNFDYEGE